MFIIVEKTMHGSVLQGHTEAKESLGLQAGPRRSGKEINANIGGRCQVRTQEEDD